MEYQFVIPVETAAGVKLTFTSKGLERLRDLGEQGVSPKAIAERLGAHPQTVARKLTEMGIRRPWALSTTPWNDERIELLKRLWTEGLSAGQIAGRLGGVTRNAVLGKIHRLGLSGRVIATRIVEKKRAKPKRAAPRPAGNPVVRVLFKEPICEPATEELDIPLHERKTIDTLEPCSCRWPIGEPQDADFHFCGRTKVEGLSYCEFHARRAFRPPEPRKKAVKTVLHSIGGRLKEIAR